MADAITGNTQVGATKDTVTAEIVQRELAAASNLLPLVTDYSALAVPGHNTVRIPRASSFTVVNRASGAAGDATALTLATDSISLSFKAYVAWIIDSADAVQMKPDYELLAIRNAVAAHGRYVDAQILAVLEADGDATATAGAITDAVFLEMRETLSGQFANENELSFVGSPAVIHDLMAIDKFVDMQRTGRPRIVTGEMGELYGVRIVQNKQLTGNTYYMFERGGVGFASQVGAQVSRQPANEYGSQAERVAMDQLFGVDGLQIGQAGATGSALILKDAN